MAMGLEPDVIYDLVQLKPCYDSVPWYQFRCFIYFWVVPYFYPYYSALGTNYFLVNIRILFISDHPILFFCPVISGKGWWTMSFSGWAGDEPFLLKCQDLEKKKKIMIFSLRLNIYGQFEMLSGPLEKQISYPMPLSPSWKRAHENQRSFWFQFMETHDPVSVYLYQK